MIEERCTPEVVGFAAKVARVRREHERPLQPAARPVRITMADHTHVIPKSALLRSLGVCGECGRPRTAHPEAT